MSQLLPSENALSARFTRDPHRPRYHVMPPANWMNDPNGPIYWRGQYHLFYQYNPDWPGVVSNPWENGHMHWGHAVSADLLRWQHLPVAISPTPDGPDKDGAWSGCIVDIDGVPTAFYTGVHPEVQCLATSDDDLITWHKLPEPVIAMPPEGMQLTGFRDPCVWREEDGWYMAIGSGVRNVGGAVLLYHSPDARRWEYRHPLLTGERGDTGKMWECPDFFRLGDKHVLLLSIIGDCWYGRTMYMVGTYVGHRFTPEVVGTLDAGGYAYAHKTCLDATGRRLLWAWINESRKYEAQRASGWAGVMSLPTLLSLDAAGHLCFMPAPALHQLRRGNVHAEAVPLSESPWVLDLGGDSLEIAATIEPGTAEEVTLAVRCSATGSEETCIAYRPKTRLLSVKRLKASAREDDLALDARDVRTGTVTIGTDDILRLRVFLDRSVLEVYANETFYAANRIYPTCVDSLGVRFSARGGTATLSTCECWHMDALDLFSSTSAK